MKDYYQILGISYDASKQDIKDAFRKLSLQYHPDRQGNKSEKEKKEAEAKFKEVAEAYEILGNDSKKSQYDNMRTFGGNSEKLHFGTMDNPFSVFDDFFDLFGGKKSHNTWTQKKSPQMDININIYVTLSEVYNLDHKQIIFSRKKYCESCVGTGHKHTKKCPYCGGTGVENKKFASMKGFYIHETCKYCNGTGYVYDSKCEKCNGNGFTNQTSTFEFNIPAGCYDGCEVTYKDQGNILGDKKGNLIIKIHINTGINYRISQKTLNLETNIEVPILVCLIGGKTRINLPDNSQIDISIPENTCVGSIYKIHGKGLMRADMSRADLLVCVHYKMPKNISDKDMEILKKLASHKAFL